MYVCMNCGKMMNLAFVMKLDKEAELELCPDCARETMKKKRLAEKKK